MDLNRISAFVRVVADGSFTAAAKALGLPKSSVSRSVAQLEDELGIRLLHRTTRKLRLTDGGTAFYERVARALSDIERATETASDMQSELRGTVRVTAPVDLGVATLGGAVARFARKHPNIVVDLSLTGRVVDLVAEGFDLAVRVGPLRDSSLVARRIGELNASLLASPKYLARRRTPKSLDELSSHECILFRPTLGKSAWRLHDMNGEQRDVTVSGAIVVDDLSFVRRVALAGAGIALLPDFLCEREIQSGKLVRVLEDWSTHGGVLHVVYPSAQFVPQRVVAFREFLFRELSKVTARCAVAERERSEHRVGKRRLESASP